MSLTATPVNMTDILNLQAGIEGFTNPAEATAEVTAINAGTDTVAAYAAKLEVANAGQSEAVMATVSLMEGGTPTAGKLLTPTSPANEFQHLTVTYLPTQQDFATKNGLNITLYNAEVVGLGIGAGGDCTQNNFLKNFGSSKLTLSQFEITLSGLTLVSEAAIDAQYQFFVKLYGGAPANLPAGYPNADAAARATTFGFAVGTDLANPALNPTLIGQLENAKVLNAETINGDVTGAAGYQNNVAIGSQPKALPLQGGAGPNLSIVDIIPRQDSFETDQNSEPSIAVNPTNAMQMIVSAFGGVNAPFFDSMNGGATWSSFGNLNHGDTSLAWKPDGSAVLATTLMGVAGNPDIGSVINTYSSTVANGNFGFPINQSPGNGLDQPWIETGPSNHVYVGYTQPASVLVSSDGGAHYNSITLDRAVGPLGDDPSVRVAVNGDTVYAVFDRFITQIEDDGNGGARFDSQLVVVKSVNGGADFTALGNGVQVATPIVPFAGPSAGNENAKVNTPLTLGQNRSDMGTSIAVDPNDANHVVVAFSTAPGEGVIQLVVQESTNGGLNWTQKFITSATTRSAESSVAILADGAIGLLYDNYDPITNKLSQHLVTTTNDFATTTDTTLATASNLTPVNQGQPYLGDYINLTSRGNTFYGVFSASNADNGTDALIPNVSFQRNFTGTPGTPSFQLTDANGNKVAPSIDLFFFTETLLTPAANLIGVAPHLDHATV